MFGEAISKVRGQEDESLSIVVYPCQLEHAVVVGQQFSREVDGADEYDDEVRVSQPENSS